jgi:hypothetical protein
LMEVLLGGDESYLGRSIARRFPTSFTDKR